MTIEESIHVTFDETNITSPRKEFLDDIADSLEDAHNEERNLKRKREMKKTRMIKMTQPKKMIIFPKNGKLQEITLLTTS